jgi:hypothetical protein
MTLVPKDPTHGELEGMLRGALKNQYRAALNMLQEAVERCPESKWEKGNPPFWQIAYHTVFFAHFYMARDESSFRAWEHHRPKYQSLDSPPKPMGEPYTRAQVLDYLTQCAAIVDPAIDALDLASPESGHIQHHTIYLSAELRASNEKPVTWISPHEH